VVGIFGDWGQGKTTVLNFMKSKLDSAPLDGDPKVITVMFNPWRFSSEDELLLSFFTTLSRTVGKKIKSTHSQVSEAIDKYSFLFKPTKLLVGLDAEKAAQEMAKRIGTDSVEDLKANLDKILRSSQQRVVVFMDDIDRLDRHEIQAVFRLIKLVANFDNTAYVLFFDDEMVAAALKEQYGGGDLAAGRAFLEKVVQVPLHLPSISQIAFDRYFEDNVKQALTDAEVALTAEEWTTFIREFGKGLRDRLKTPRMCKRYSNALTFALSLLRDDVNSVDLMLVEGVRLLRPEFYSVLRTRIDLLVQDKTDAKKVSEETYPETDRQGRTAAANLLGFLFSTAEPEASAMQRIASRRYASRYFSYAVPMEQVTEEEMSVVFSDAASRNIDEVREKVTGIVERSSTTPQDFLVLLRGRLSRWSSGLTVQPAHDDAHTTFANLAVALAGTEGLFQVTTVSRPSQLAVVITELIAHMTSPSDQFAALQRVVEQSVSITLAYECLMVLSDSTWPDRLGPVHPMLVDPAVLPWRLLCMTSDEVDEIAALHDDPSLRTLWQEWYGPLARAINMRVLNAVIDGSLFDLCDAATGKELLGGVMPSLPHEDFVAWQSETKKCVGVRVQAYPTTAVVLIGWFSGSFLEVPEVGISLSQIANLEAVVSCDVLYEIATRAFPRVISVLKILRASSKDGEHFFKRARTTVQNEDWGRSWLSGDDAASSGTAIEDARDSIVRFLAINLWHEHQVTGNT